MSSKSIKLSLYIQNYCRLATLLIVMYPEVWMTLSLMHFPEKKKQKTNTTKNMTITNETNGVNQACGSKRVSDVHLNKINTASV